MLQYFNCTFSHFLLQKLQWLYKPHTSNTYAFKILKHVIIIWDGKKGEGGQKFTFYASIYTSHICYLTHTFTLFFILNCKQHISFYAFFGQWIHTVLIITIHPSVSVNLIVGWALITLNVLTGHDILLHPRSFTSNISWIWWDMTQVLVLLNSLCFSSMRHYLLLYSWQRKPSMTIISNTVHSTAYSDKNGSV